jgi:hypothetical protein
MLCSVTVGGYQCVRVPYAYPEGGDMLLGNIGNHLQDHVVSKRPESMLHPDFCGNNIQFSLKQQSSDYQKSSTG